MPFQTVEESNFNKMTSFQTINVLQPSRDDSQILEIKWFYLNQEKFAVLVLRKTLFLCSDYNNNVAM